MRKIFLFLLITVFFAFKAVCQNNTLKFDHLDNIAALTNRSVTAIAQDEKGFIWFGTQDGLLRYDGYSVKIYKHDPANENTLSDNNIRDLLADQNGHLWIATQGGGLNKFIVDEERFVHYKSDEQKENTISGNAVWTLLIDVSDNLWTGSWSNGLDKFDVENNQFTQISSNAADPVLAIYEDYQGGIWFSSEGVTYYNPETGKSQVYRSNPNDSSTLSSNNVRAIRGDSTGIIWIATDNAGLNRLDIASGQIQRFSKANSGLNSNSIYDIHFDSHNRMWLATNNGINIWDLDNNTFSYLQNDATDPLSLSNNSPRVIFQDQAGTLWIGNEGGKINKAIDKKAFETYNTENGLTHNLMRCLFEDDDGKIWIGTQGGGLNILDRETGNVAVMAQDSSAGIYVPSSEISAIYKDENGIYWIGTWGNGVYALDYVKNTVRQFKGDASSRNALPDDRIQIFHKDRFGTFWVGTENGLATFDQDSIWTDFEGLNASNIQGQAFVEQPDGTLWIGTWNGLNKINPERTKIESWPNDDQEEDNKLNNDHVISLFIGKNDILWIGTFGGGLNKFDLTTGKFSAYTEKDGLPNGTIYGIRGDKEGNLWMSTNNGLSRFNPKTEKFRNYDKTEGLQGNEFYWGAAGALRNGSLMFGGVNGLNIFDPEDIKDNTKVPPVVITDFQIYNRPVGIGEDSVLEKSITYSKSLDLSYKDAVLTFSFAALNFNHAEKNQYAYMLEGFEDTWNYVGNKHTATYTNLDPGDYTLKIKGSNNDNVWNEEGTTLDIYISPPFWRTWWFYILVALAAFGVIRTFIKIRERSLEHDKRILESRIQEARDEVEKQKQAIADQREKEKERIWKDQAIVSLGEVLSRSKDNIKELTDEVLKSIVKYLEVPVAAIYIAEKNEQGEKQLKMLGNYGYGKAKRTFNIGAGLVGECFNEREVNYVDNLPSEYLKIESGLGGASPATLLLIPLKYEDIIIGVMEIASFHPIEEFQREFLVQFSERLTTAINNTLMGEQTKKLLEESKVKEEELKVREEELQQNLEEMQAMNEDRDRRTKELEGIIEQLKAEIDEYKKKLKGKAK